MVNKVEHRVIFSMEMSSEQLTMRLLSMCGHIDLHKLRSGQLDDDDWPRLTAAIAMLAEAPIFMDESPALSPTEVRARARRLARKHGSALIIVDYVQLMQIPGFKENRTAEVTQISRELKALAKELNIPVIALSQLNRNLEQRQEKRPLMSDLRDSGSIEQDSDLIVFLYRDEVYNEDSPQRGTAELIIAKQRNGPTATLTASFLGSVPKFVNFAPQ